MPTTAEWKVVRVPADHPAWNAIDDDDWSGHTFGSWLSRLKGTTVVIWPPTDYGDRIGRFLMALLNAGAERIVSGEAYDKDIDSSLKEVRNALKRLADAAAAAANAERDNARYAEIMYEFRNVLHEARQLLQEAP